MTEKLRTLPLAALRYASQLLKGFESSDAVLRSLSQSNIVTLVIPTIHPAERISLDEPQWGGFEAHVPELDGIRGLAALAVVFYHLALFTRSHSHGVFLFFLDSCLVGDFGVDVFFALSGFLITRILIRKRKEDHFYRNFYGRRILRLAPPYLIILLLLAVVMPGNGRFLLLSLVYMTNFFALFHIPASYGPLWTLSVEEQFYLLWPSVIRNASKQCVACISIAVCLGTPLLRMYEAFHGGFNEFLSWYRFDGLAWGALLAVVFAMPAVERRGRQLFLVFVAVGGLILLVAAGGLFHGGLKQQAFALLYSVAPMLAVSLIGLSLQGKTRVLAPLRLKVLRFFGDISYWLYLIHLLVLYEATLFVARRVPSLTQRGGFFYWMTLAVDVLGVSIISGVAVRRWIELPALRYKARFQ